MTGIRAWTTTVRDGHVREPGALSRYLKRRSMPFSAATGEQVHRARMAVVPALNQTRVYAGVDGLLTREINQPLAIFTADCVPLFLHTHDRQWIGVLHAGWRGTQQQILKAAVQRLKRDGVAPRDIRVWAGPSIGPCCFAVRWDVARFFPDARRRWKDRWSIDLWKALKDQSRRLGIEWTGRRPPCTGHDKRYYSFRRNGTDRRQASIIVKSGDHEK